MSGRPNILFLMMDQLRWDALGCSGGWVNTPHLDAVAGRGVRFSNCFTASPLCIPARVALATGLYAHNTGVWRNLNYTLAPEAHTWMQVVRNAGYRTSLFGKTHLHPHHGDLREREHLLHAYGLDDVDEIGGPHASTRVLSHMTARWEEKGLWEPYKKGIHEAKKPPEPCPSQLPLEDYADVYVGQQAKQYLQTYNREEPWFCWVSFGGPHEPWDAPEPYASMYNPNTMPEPTTLETDSTDRPRGYLDKLWQLQAQREHTDYKRLRANYAGNVTLIDEQIGEILGAIAERNELENTIIVLTSDHGEMNGDHGLLFKTNFLNGAVRIPLIVATPETARNGVGGKASSTPVELIDVGATLAELAGGAIEYQQFARSLCPVLSDPTYIHRTEVVSEIHGEFMIYDGRWKLVVNHDGEGYLLFDQKTDPQERRNLIGMSEAEPEYTRLRGRLLERLVSSMHSADGKI